MQAARTPLIFALSLTLLAVAPGCDSDPHTFRDIPFASGGTGGGTGSDTGGLGETGTGDGDGDGSYTALLCGSVEFAYVETSTYCDAGYSIVCGFGSFLFDGSASVCCEGIECAIVPFEQGCIGDQVRVCDTL